ncbi:MAG: hypothetical protein JO051_03940, partial [Acidobacteriaceae bacterium]|nr:hypothetical protein [Acidobacteriaceae bacterium]
MGSKSIASSAGLLALIAIVVRALGGSASDRHTDQTPPQAMPDLSASAANSEAKELPLAFQGPWTTTRQFFHRDPSLSNDVLAKCFQENLTETCVSDLVRHDLYAFPRDPKDTPKLQALIATVPDPLHTRMSMETDRYLDA